MMFQPYAIHIAVSASNRIDVLLETSGATSISPITPNVAARRTQAADNGRAATIARTMPTRKISKFIAVALALADSAHHDLFGRSRLPPLRGSSLSDDKFSISWMFSTLRGELSEPHRYPSRPRSPVGRITST